MRSHNTLLGTVLSASILVYSSNASAQSDDAGWYLKPTIALSQLSDETGNTTGIGNSDGIAPVNLNSGFASGLVLGYDYGSSWSAELGWEYRSNDSEVTLADGTGFSDGNYASNTFFINGIYKFDTDSQWQPYLGAGLSFIQEIDIDLESNATELSYSGDSETGFQFFAGIEREIGGNWSILGEARYTNFDELELEGENTAGRFSNLGYSPVSLQLGLKYSF